MKILVTGAGGFIGSNLIHKLNAKGYTEILAVDDLSDGLKYRNLLQANIDDYQDLDGFYDKLLNNYFGKFDYIFHEGACSDTMEHNGKYMLANNYEISKKLFMYSARENSCLNYASSAAVYGKSRGFEVSERNETPLNVYGFSKLLFDNFVRKNNASAVKQIVGLRYFNVYGPRESHKGKMASVAYNQYMQFTNNQPIRLFGSYGGYGEGCQMRDFIYIDDLIEVKLWLMENQNVRGIFNLGTGRAQAFNDVALGVINGLNRIHDKPCDTLENAIKEKKIQYVQFPEALIGRYQCYTRAEISDLRNHGYQGKFRDVESGMFDYVSWLAKEEQQ